MMPSSRSQVSTSVAGSRWRRLALEGLVLGVLAAAVPSAALAAPGDRLWVDRHDSRTFGGNPGPRSDDRGVAIGVSPDGARVYTAAWPAMCDWAGSCPEGGSRTVRYAAPTGAVLARDGYHGRGVPAALAISPAERVYLTGSVTDSAGNEDVLTQTPFGCCGLRWYNGPAGLADRGNDLVASPDNSRVYVTGASTGASTGADFITLAYDGFARTRSWTRRTNGPANGHDEAVAIAISPDGSRLYVTGTSAGGASGDDLMTTALDSATGAVVWNRRIAGSGADSAADVAVSPDGTRVYVAGTSAGPTADDQLIASYSSDGTLQWTKRYDGPAHGNDAASELVVSPDGARVFMTGWSSGGASDDDELTTAWDTSGARLWTKRYDGPGHASDRGVGIGVSPDGTRVFVTDASTGVSSMDVATRAYAAANGATLWTRRFDAPSGLTDEPADLVVDPGGSRVYVAGTTRDTAGDRDALTIAYGA